MGSQEAWPLDASRQSGSGLFSPASENSLNVDITLSSGSRKRKRDGRSTMDDLLDDSFVVKSYPSTLSTKPRTLKPVALLHRSYLPLSAINASSSSNPLPDSRLFEAHVKILELEDRMGNKPMLVIARLDDGKSMYAVERESRGLYALCRLGSWVDLDKLCSAAVVSRQHHLNVTRNSLEHAHIQDSAGQSDATPQSSKYSKKKRLAIEAIQSMVKRPTAETSAYSQAITPVETPNSEYAPVSIAEEFIVQNVRPDEPVPQPAASDILDNIRSQYLETLYLSKASLGYFAKGPLSRARAAFHLDYDSTLDMTDLIEFLDSLVLPTTILDKKYKDGVPEVVSTLIIGEGSADEADTTRSDLKKRKSKKMKLGKTGFYPTEDNYLRRWWAAHDDDTESGGPGQSKDEIGRKRVAQLRIRETQLQMIVILETLALQPLASPQAEQGGELPFGGLKEEAADGKQASKSKAKKQRDLPGLIDVHVDRLCIWQSLAAEEGRTSSKSSVPDDSGGAPNDLDNAHRHAADVLREFCVEVIVPFFSARLPEQCGAISRKLGGPVVSSPSARPKLTKSASTSSSLTRPGAVTKRPAPIKARRSLQRVLTDERHSRSGSRGPSGAISLMRSATAPIVPGLKREASETPSMSNIPAADSQTMHVSRGGVIKSKKFSQREVDLSIMVNVSDAKLKKASIEAELREAITALKRPNRQLAGQLQVDTAEKRVSTATSHSRKSKKPVRNPLFQGVQIMATPKINRRKDVELDNLPERGSDLERDYEAQTIPASSIPRIPQSVARFVRSSGSSSICKATPAHQPPERTFLSAVQGTPCRAPTQSRLSESFENKGSDADGGIPPSSPLQSRHRSKQQTLGVPRPLMEQTENFRTPTRPGKIQATPIKQSSYRNIENEDPFQIVISTPAPVVTEKGGIDSLQKTESVIETTDSIYKSLGWDDFDDF